MVFIIVIYKGFIALARKIIIQKKEGERDKKVQRLEKKNSGFLRLQNYICLMNEFTNCSFSDKMFYALAIAFVFLFPQDGYCSFLIRGEYFIKFVYEGKKKSLYFECYKSICIQINFSAFLHFS